jgi:hypothetical protein
VSVTDEPEYLASARLMLRSAAVEWGEMELT